MKLKLTDEQLKTLSVIQSKVHHQVVNDIAAELLQARKRLVELEGIAIDMVREFCLSSISEPYIYSHDFKSTPQYVFECLIEYGLAKWTDERKAFIMFTPEAGK
ncbi:MAG: hypothetical protein C0391_03825 [Anaerolinea sp.]|nr:hypothetical protein [Anaerolinea sp.]